MGVYFLSSVHVASVANMLLDQKDILKYTSFIGKE